MNSKGTFWLPPVIAPVTSGQDSHFYFIYWLCVFAFILLTFLIIFFSLRYHHRKHPRGHIEKESITLEVAWTVISSLLFVVIFWWGIKGWISLGIPPQNPL